ncbi:MAG: addiction module protein [Bacteroidetes bacterium]|nr:addiction module protein [Bacteroidota bacterium]
MSNQELKEKIAICMEDAEDHILEAVLTLLMASTQKIIPLTEEQMKIVEERHADYLAGRGEYSTWEEVKARITSKQ